MVAPPLPSPAKVAGGSAAPAPPPEAAWASLCEGIQQDMMLAMLVAFQGMAAACAEVCVQRMQLVHLEVTRAVEHEVEEAKAKARHDGHPNSAPIFQSLADAVGQKTRLGQLCHQEPFMTDRCHPTTLLETIYEQLGGTASPRTAELFKLVASAGSGATSARCERQDSDPVKHDFPTVTPPDSDPKKHDIPSMTPTRPHWTPSPEGDHASEDQVIRCATPPQFPGGRELRPDYCNGGDLGLLSATGTKIESKTDGHYSACSSTEQVQQTPPQHGSRYAMAEPLRGACRPTGGSCQESPSSVSSGSSGSDSFFHPQGGPAVAPMTGMAPALPEGPMLTPMAEPLRHRHAQIWEAKEHMKEQHAQNFFEA